MEIAIGTVQFGLDYGITNINGQTKGYEVEKILNFAKQSNISVLDTSPAYGQSEEKLGRINLESFKVITKLEYINKDIIRPDDIDEIELVFMKSLLRLGVNSVYGVFVHNPEDLCKPGSKGLYEKLIDLKSRGLVKKIGVSVYDVVETKKIFNMYDFDMIQLPINVFNQSFESEQILKFLKTKSVEIYARSIFLQGVLLSELEELPDRFTDLKIKLNEYYTDLERSGISKIEGALKYINEIKEIDYAIVGINNINQLKAIDKTFNDLKKYSSTPFDFQTYSINDEKIIDPRKW
jgi:aryl-alcohol dehydrogenase-like predicted oxidoreductase